MKIKQNMEKIVVRKKQITIRRVSNLSDSRRGKRVSPEEISYSGKSKPHGI